VFIIMRYAKDAVYEALEKTIKGTVYLQGFKASLAKDAGFHDELWRNIEFCMENSRYAIVVFERAAQPEFNPNVAVELGYMLGKGKHCLLIKEESIPMLPTDFAGRRYEAFKLTQNQTHSFTSNWQVVRKPWSPKNRTDSDYRS
jgi:hypothetical protein